MDQNSNPVINKSGLTVVIAGASGFIGKALIKRLSQDPRVSQIIALSREHKEPHQVQINENLILEWRQADLFSLLDAENAVSGADVAYYLVHSMSPTAALDQGSFQDYDLIMSDNFARACAKHNLKQVIYLGGIIPTDCELSPHLHSRLEVEKTLASFGTPVTSLRAGLIIGAEGSSFNILLKLVDRVPTMLVPPWAQIRTQTIAVTNVIDCLCHCLNNPFTFSQSFDLGGPEVMTYESLLRETAEVLGKRRWFIPMPLLQPWMVRRWLVFIADAPKALVYPLVQSLKHSIQVRPQHALLVPGIKWLSFKEAAQAAIDEGALKEKPHAYSLPKEIKQKHEVRSVQRMKIPKKMKADALSFAYQHWLPRFLWPFLRVKKTGNRVAFHFWGIKDPLLLLELSYKRSSPDRQLLYIKGGLLSQESKRGRLEFREVLGGSYLIAAIHDFKPRLPWWLYVHTQAPMHLFVMNAFHRWLRKKEKPDLNKSLENQLSQRI